MLQLSWDTQALLREDWGSLEEIYFPWLLLIVLRVWNDLILGGHIWSCLCCFGIFLLGVYCPLWFLGDGGGSVFPSRKVFWDPGELTLGVSGKVNLQKRVRCSGGEKWQGGASHQGLLSSLGTREKVSRGYIRKSATALGMEKMGRVKIWSLPTCLLDNLILWQAWLIDAQRKPGFELGFEIVGWVSRKFGKDLLDLLEIR